MGLGGGLAIEAASCAMPLIKLGVPANPAHCGDAGWEDRAAIRGGRRPRAGGAKPLEAVLFFLSTSPQAGRLKVIHSLALVLIYEFRVVVRNFISFIIH